MATYTVTNELQSMEFHDSVLDNIYMEDKELHMVFSDAILMGRSTVNIKDHIPCSVNTGEDRYACPVLAVSFRNFQIRSVLRGGCRTTDAAGNTIEEYPPRNLSPEEYGPFLQMLLAEKGNQVCGLYYDVETKIYTLCFFMKADPNYYEMEFTADTAVAAFEEFGKEAWYLDSKWRTCREDPKTQNS